ncbi:MAG: potassium channel protein [Chitinophagales bacterium]|nr:potassium channel protein [Bacteroidota bacterium]MCB9043879.1 potassium channel protein [Chitinophagales bacterium]
MSQTSHSYYIFWKLARHFIISVLLFILSLVTGVLGYYWLENYSLINSFYMAIITVSTVGFTEVETLSEAGRIFTSFYILANLIIFAYAVSSITYFITNGNLKVLFQDFFMFRKIEKMKNHIIVCGYGRYGSEISAQFRLHNMDFVVIDNKPEAVEKMRNIPNFNYIDGDVTQDETLLQAGIEYARALVTTVSEDIENVYVVLTARQINPTLNIISRGIDAKSERKLLQAGANHVIMPERIGGFYMATLVGKPDVVEFFRILTQDTGVSVSFVVLPNKDFPHHLINKTIRDLDIRSKTGANVIGIKTPQGDYVVNPAAETPLLPGLEIIVLGQKTQLVAFEQLFEYNKH